MEALVEESSFLKRLYDEVRGPLPTSQGSGGRCGDWGGDGREGEDKGMLCACVCMCVLYKHENSMYTQAKKACVWLSQTSVCMWS